MCFYPYYDKRCIDSMQLTTFLLYVFHFKNRIKLSWACVICIQNNENITKITNYYWNNVSARYLQWYKTSGIHQTWNKLLSYFTKLYLHCPLIVQCSTFSECNNTIRLLQHFIYTSQLFLAQVYTPKFVLTISCEFLILNHRSANRSTKFVCIFCSKCVSKHFFFLQYNIGYSYDSTFQHM